MRILLDTFVLVEAAANPEFGMAVQHLLSANGHELVVGKVNLMEIAQWPKRWDEVADFVASVPFCIAESPEKIAAREIEAYPGKVTLPLAYRSSDSALSREDTGSIIRRAIERDLAPKVSSFGGRYSEILESILAQRSSYQPKNGEGYSEEQKWLFLNNGVLRMLLPEHAAFLRREISPSKSLSIEVLKSVFVQILAVFLEYYVQGKQGRPSDVGDIYQMGVLPYVDMAVVDRERADLARRISRESSVLKGVKVLSIGEFRAQILT